jgi:hypothetical protein
VGVDSHFGEGISRRDPGSVISRDLVLLYGGALRLDAPERGTGLIVTVILPS